MTENEELKVYLKKYNLDYVKISEITGLTHGSIKTTLQPNNKEVPGWLKLFLHIKRIKNEVLPNGQSYRVGFLTIKTKDTLKWNMH